MLAERIVVTINSAAKDGINTSTKDFHLLASDGDILGQRMKKAWPPGDTHRPIKRLFTPEIKRMLKDWLVRRRDNPYPNREEKKQLANETGLTYTQICNWFANWRRKLKNSGNDPNRKTWGNLIKNYNNSAKGNVEQFSICSSDSIWGENGDDSQESRSPTQSFPRHGQYVTYANNNNNNKNNINNNNKHGFVNYMEIMNRRGSELSDSDKNESYSGNMYSDHCYTPKNYCSVFGIPGQRHCVQTSSTNADCSTDFNANTTSIITASFPHAYRADNGTYYLTPSTTVCPASNQKTNTNKYKNSIMEKYLRDLGEGDPDVLPTSDGEPSDCANPFQQSQPTISSQQTSYESRGPPSLSKWLESTAKFTPSKNNYIDWDQPGKPCTSKKRGDSNYFNHPSSPQPPTSTSSHPQGLETTLHREEIHQKDEIDAAEALTRLANNFRLKFYT
ncbi:GATA zinc finger domain-containing protein 14 [Sabethes cyaneus]|uniref:GATA zinc finger domain-containing protein 14 n=1 Tax=Sabethes cyaneus TaxID=53552 RepID=UPI00237EC035|nr:GATA zinc finger domain-containing protein 14 [Sabethes cyaneus]